MKNKKGFTLIEIIIAISLIAVIGTSVFLISLNNIKKSNKERLEKLHNQILNAANVFIFNEKDEEGVNYNSAINIGAKGVKIPITYLVNKGYIDEKTVSEVYKLEKLDNSKNYFVLAVNGGSENNQDYCDAGDITFTLSWMDEDKPIYLCKAYKKYTETKETVNNIQEVQYNVRLKVTLNKNAVSEIYYNSLNDSDKSNFVKDENGIFTLNDEGVGKLYSYYRGSVDNNYLKLGKDNSGNDLMWRIVWLNEDNKIKLVLDKEIQLSILKKNGETYYINKKDTILDFNIKNSSNKYYPLNSDQVSDSRYPIKNKYSDRYYIIKINSNNLLNEFTSLEDDINSTSSIYYKTLMNWYNETNLNEYFFITSDKNFCKNNFYRDRSDGDENYSYEPSDTFACIYGRYNGNKKDIKADYTKSNLFYSSPVGFLTYGDVVRAGVSISANGSLNNNNSYLLNEGNLSYPLIDDYKYYFWKDSKGGRDYNRQIYYIDNNGLNTGKTYKEERVSSNNDTYYYYSLQDENNNFLFEDGNNNGKNGSIMRESTFLANSIKPAIIIDLTNKLLSGNGTNDSPFIIVDKQ